MATGSVSRKMGRVLTVPAILAAGAAPVAGQVHTIPDEISCSACVIRLGDPTRLRGVGADLGPVRYMVEDSRGMLYTTVMFDETILAVYDSAGRRVNTLGRRGSGPGEFQNIRFARLHFDTLVVHDSRLARQSLFVNNRLVRTRRVPGNAWAGVTAGGWFFINAVVPEGAAAGAPLHRLASDGRLDRSGGGSARFRADEMPLMHRSLAAGEPGTFWAAHPTQYVIERWDAELRAVTRFERSAQWFVPHAVASILPGRSPQPRLRAIHYDEQGRLWVLLHVADARWRQTFRAGINDDTAFDGRLDVYYDSLIEVIDPRSRSVIARHRMDAYASAFTTRGKLVIYGEDRGEPYLDVVPLTLQTGR